MVQIFVVLLCLILNAFLAAFEMAFVAVSKAELRALVKRENLNAKLLLKLREHPERTLSLIQVGITLVGVVAAATGGAGAGEVIEPWLMGRFHVTEEIAEVVALVLVVVPLTGLNVVIGELVPKTLALRNPTKIVLWGAGFVKVMDRMFSPLVTALEFSTKKILSWFFPASDPGAGHQGDLLTLELHEFSPVHRNFILNMVDIEKKQLGEILLPWSEVVKLDKESSMAEVFATMIKSGHTRLPVVDKNQIVGILHTKEFMSLREMGSGDWLNIVRPTLYFKSSDSALGAMRLLQERHTHMAMVLSLEGQCLGIVTLEDILEEIVGDIFDEDDEPRIAQVMAAKIKAKGFLRTENK